LEDAKKKDRSDAGIFVVVALVFISSKQIGEVALVIVYLSFLLAEFPKAGGLIGYGRA